MLLLPFVASIPAQSISPIQGLKQKLNHAIVQMNPIAIVDPKIAYVSGGFVGITAKQRT